MRSTSKHIELYPSKFFNFVFMGSIRQNKIEAVIQTELAVFFQRHSAEICLGAMVTVTIVRVTSDLSHARCFLSIFTGPDKQTVLENINLNKGKVRLDIGKRLKNMRKIPSLTFHIDDSLDYALKIDELLKK
jgi:ribosome-binding factor A